MTEIIDKRKKSNTELAFLDLFRGAKMYNLWLTLAWLEIKQRYRRSLIGPFWITASTGVMIGTMGPLYGYLFNQNISNYIQYVAVSMILWNFISNNINESGMIFVASESYMKQIPLPLTVYVYRHLAKSLIMFAHNIVLVPVVYLFFPLAREPNYFLVLLAVLVLCSNLFWLNLFLAIVGTRYRDIPQIVANLIQVAFFLSPILWRADMLKGKGRFFTAINPLYHFVEIMRAPILGETIYISTWLVCIVIAILGCGVTFILLSLYRSRIAYWI